MIVMNISTIVCPLQDCLEKIMPERSGQGKHIANFAEICTYIPCATTKMKLSCNTYTRRGNLFHSLKGNLPCIIRQTSSPLLRSPKLVLLCSDVTATCPTVDTQRATIDTMPSTLTTGPSLSLALGCLNTHHSRPTKAPIQYKPGDLIPAFIEVHKHRSFDALSLHGSLIGTYQLAPNDVFRRSYCSHC